MNMYKGLELYSYFFQGILFFQIIALLVFYYITRRRDSLFFMLFLLFASANFFIAAPELFYNMKDEEVLDSRWFRFLNTPFAMLSGLFFTLFLKEFFSDLLNYPFFEKVLSALIKIQIFLFLPFYILFFLNQRTELIFNFVNFFGVGMGAWLVYVIFTRKILYAKIVAFGTVLYLLGSITTTYLLIQRLSPNDNVLVMEFPFFPLKLGILIQTISYLIAIFNKWHQQTLIEKTTAVLRERDRISAELHDELGSSISGISLYSFLAQKQLETNSTQVISSLEIIKNNAAEVVEKLKDIIWLNNRKDETMDTLFKRLENNLNEMARTKNILVETRVDHSDSPLLVKDSTSRNVYLICKEAIHNMIKYSEATKIKFTVSLIGLFTWQIILEDNGNGFDPEEENTGNGIHNMRRRAKDINADLNILSSKGKGTKIILLIKTTQ